MMCICNKMHLCSPSNNCVGHYGLHDEQLHCTTQIVSCERIRYHEEYGETLCISGAKLEEYMKKHFELFL